MHVGLVAYGSLDRRSGGNLYDKRLVDTLRRRDHRVEILSLPQSSYLGNLGHNLSADVERRLRRDAFDLLLEDELTHPSLLRTNTKLRRAARYPVVSIVHHLRASEDHPWWARGIYRAVEHRYLRSVDAFVCNSSTTEQSVRALVGNRPPSIVAPPGGDRLEPTVTAQSIGHRAHEAGPLRIVFVGNLIPRKGLPTLLRAVAHIEPQAWRLDVVGDTAFAPGYAAGIRRLIERLNLAGSVELHGSLDDHELAQVLGRSHVLAVPSAWEGFGIVYLEAMGFGLPAIGTTAGAAHEVIEHGRTGFLVPPGDDRALFEHLRAIAEDRHCLAELGCAALDRYLRRPTWDVSTTPAAEFLEQLARTGASREKPTSPRRSA